MDYETFAFEAMAKNDLLGTVFKCNSGTLPDGSCACVFAPSAETIAKYGECMVSGRDVLDYLRFGGLSTGAYVGILISIIVIYRVLMYVALAANFDCMSFFKRR